MATPQELQRRADSWLQSVRRELGDGGRIACGRVTFEPLDGLRAILELTNARLLGGGRPAAVTPRDLLYRVKSFIDRHTLPARALPRAKPTLLALPRQAGHLHDILPVARALRLHERYALFGVVDPQLIPDIEASGHEAVGLHAVAGAHPSERWTAYRFSHSLLDTAARLSSPDTQILAASTARTVRRHLPRALEVGRAVERLVERHNLSLVLVGNPYTMEGRTAALVARQLGVPSVGLEHGTIFPNSPRWSECPVDLMCVWGEPSAQALATCGVPRERIAVTGAPRLDEVVHSAAGVRDRHEILVASSGAGDQVSLEEHRAFIQAVFAAAEAVPDSRWVVKLHPKDKEEYYTRDGRLGTDRISVVRGKPRRKGLDIFDYLHRAAALVTIASSTALDAMLVDVPVITVGVGASVEGLRKVEFLQRGCTRAVRDADSLAQEVRDALRGVRHEETCRAARAYADRHFANRGQAAAATAARIEEVIDGIRSTKRR